MDMRGSIASDGNYPDNLSEQGVEVANNNLSSIGNPQTGLADKRADYDINLGANNDDTGKAASIVVDTLSRKDKLHEEEKAGLHEKSSVRQSVVLM